MEFKLTRNDDELSLARAESLEGRLVTQDVLAGLHNKRKARVDGVGLLLGLLGSCSRIVSRIVSLSRRR